MSYHGMVAKFGITNMNPNKTEKNDSKSKSLKWIRECLIIVWLLNLISLTWIQIRQKNDSKSKSLKLIRECFIMVWLLNLISLTWIQIRRKKWFRKQIIKINKRMPYHGMVAKFDITNMNPNKTEKMIQKANY